MSGAAQDDLDDLLDDALEDFQTLKVESKAKEAPSTATGKPKFDPLGKARRKPGGKKKAKKGAQAAPQLPPRAEGDGTDSLMDKLAEQFAGGIEDDGELQSMVDSVMRQLLSKEVLYEPLQEISGKYPQWLEENESKVSEEDFERYSRQLESIKKLCSVYESTDDEGFDDVLHLMQEIQSCGQPPEEIIKELAPDLQVGEDGLPVPATGVQDALHMFGELGKDKTGGCPIQ
ncbi:peroxisome biogenesis protein 19 [Chloropicon primus]|uniref:Peroxisome biogenesis protein 19 n=1 Tax=Chloropicon primus TaxID=1764295 RepID=A0A5B8MBI9_9CHLO|nr:peroxisome biogenesis protein 19 [Chloropicon primus]UPQ96807.1 peroxisome biogenesis protein 19 [Chloropicon primus]|mmetsp:Transcript_10530/g.29753  ORF Transcript_10530/g.29753 Transcript_10530/m.29753 type:complete len:231 (+) Transcript_10530:88-780(+)|eukprot:QDZ17589.1 peroxisome biogenesis protein 19 [Chloropicon primus]